MKNNIFIKPYHTILSLLLIGLAQYSPGQNARIDSLVKAAEGQQSDTNKVNTLVRLANEYSNAYNYKLTLEASEKSLELARKLGYKKGMSRSYFNLACAQRETGDYTSGIENFKKALALYDELGDRKGVGETNRELGITFKNQSQYPKALEHYLVSLKIMESLGDKKGIASNYLNIGVVYKEQKNYESALDYYFKALKIREELGSKKGVADCYNNIGVVYKNLKDYDKALEYYDKCLALRKELKDEKGAAICYTNLGVIYNIQKDHEKALHNLLLSAEIKEKANDKKGMLVTYVNLGETYNSIAQQDKALDYFEKSLKIAREVKSPEDIGVSHRGFANVYAKKGDYKNAYKHHVLFKQYNDSTFNEENSEQIMEMQTRFEVEKKEAELKARASVEQEKLQAIADAEKKRQRTILYFVGGTLLLTVAFAGFLFTRFTIINRQKKIIEMQKEVVEEKNKAITDSINYAQKIQRALLPDGGEFATIFPQSFILYKPKDIVSGDFYWCTSLKGKPHIKLYATADCTGHGVPGGFMSMLGTTFLNEIVNEKGITEPADILNLLREKVISALRQTGAVGESKDGMDITMIRLDESTNTLTYASANNTFYIMRANDLIEHKPDKMPVGYYNGVPRPFTQHTVSLEKGDIIYTFTDGYADQFGGNKNKKFTYKQLKDLIASIYSKPIDEQKTIIESTFEQWRGNYQQVDDICMIAVKVA